MICQCLSLSVLFAEINVLSTSSDSYVRGVMLTGHNTALRNNTGQHCPRQNAPRVGQNAPWVQEKNILRNLEPAVSERKH